MAHTKATTSKSTGGKAPHKCLGAKAARKTLVKRTHKRRFKPGTVALCEIHHYQKGHELLLPKAPFHCVVKEITNKVTAGKGYHIQASALEALQEMVEAFLVNEFEITNLCTIHTRCVTIQARDMQLVQQLQKHIGLNPVGTV